MFSSFSLSPSLTLCLPPLTLCLSLSPYPLSLCVFFFFSPSLVFPRLPHFPSIVYRPGNLPAYLPTCLPTYLPLAYFTWPTRVTSYLAFDVLHHLILSWAEIVAENCYHPFCAIIGNFSQKNVAGAAPTSPGYILLFVTVGRAGSGDFCSAKLKRQERKRVQLALV